MSSPNDLKPHHWRREAALALLEGDEQLLTEMIAVVLAETPQRLAELEQAVARSDLPGARAAAHGLKGQLSYLEAEAISGIIDQVVSAVRAGDPARAADGMVALRQALSDLQRELQASTASAGS